MHHVVASHLYINAPPIGYNASLHHVGILNVLTVCRLQRAVQHNAVILFDAISFKRHLNGKCTFLLIVILVKDQLKNDQKHKVSNVYLILVAERVQKC